MNNVYHILIEKKFVQQLKTYGPKTQKRILEWIINNIENQYPRKQGFQLEAYKDVWFYIDDDNTRPFVYIKDSKIFFLGFLTFALFPPIIPFIKSIDYDSLLNIRELCAELGFSYNELVQDKH